MQGDEESNRSTGVDFGQGNQIGPVSISGNVAGRDLRITTTTEAAEGVETREQLLAVIASLRAEIEQLQEASAGDREDADDELRKAAEAAEKGDSDRVVQKLDAAQRIMVGLGAAIPAAVKLGEIIATLIPRIPGLG
jgi:hypothetical protein